MKRILGITAAIAVVALATACQDDGTTPVAGGSPTVTTAPSGAGQPSGAQAPGGGQPSGGDQSPSGAQSPGTTTQSASSHAPATAGNGKCVDLKSQVVTAALGKLGGNVNDAGFYADSGTDAAIGSCPALMWVLAGTPHGTASSPWQVMLFNNKGFLGTATKNWTSYTSIVGSTDRAVQIQYRWLANQDPSCCPSGGPVVVTLTLGSDNHTVTPDRDFPTQATNPSH